MGSSRLARLEIAGSGSTPVQTANQCAACSWLGIAQFYFLDANSAISESIVDEPSIMLSERSRLEMLSGSLVIRIA